MLENESMKKPLTYDELCALKVARPMRDTFGPNTHQPYLAFYLGGLETSLSDWLKDLPCPVIGIGKGVLAQHCDAVLETDKVLSRLIRNIENAPLASMVLVQHLRMSDTLKITDKLTAESLAYSTVQNGPEFQYWLSTYKSKPLPKLDTPSLTLKTHSDSISITLSRPDTRNAIDVDMRDAICEALDFALADNSFSKIFMTGEGATFSTGGAVEEFGHVSDPTTAHWIRSLRLPAWRLARLKSKLHIHVNGAAIGAGVEMAAFGHYVSASSKAWFQLPELKYGLIPGAGGTASLAERIGRQKTAYMALSMEKISAQKALKWGLIDAIID